MKCPPGFPEPHQCGGYLHAVLGVDGDLHLLCDTCQAAGVRTVPPTARGVRAIPRTTVPTVLDVDDVPPGAGG